MPYTLQNSTKPYTDRDFSWLSFNERVLLEAAGKQVPLLERVRFLSIYSSNLDEFYRVRIPALMALKKLSGKEEGSHKKAYKATLKRISAIVHGQQQFFGTVFKEQLLPQLEQENILLLYNRPVPDEVRQEASNYFFSQVLAFLKPVALTKDSFFVTENNKLYFLVPVVTDNKETVYIVNIPSEDLPRFYSITKNGRQYIIFIDDVIRLHLDVIFQEGAIQGAYSFKITRDAALEFDDDYDEDLALQMEQKIARRDFGMATRLLYDDKMPPVCYTTLMDVLKLKGANSMKGGCYHNLKDLATLPAGRASLEYSKWPAVPFAITKDLLLDQVAQNDIIVHTPYESYDTVLRFFNEAALHKDAEEIYVTLYRVANDSRIANALISAAANGKKVTVVVELKARFDEANNIKWSKKMRDAGVTIIHSVPSLKVHAKIALVKFKETHSVKMLGLLATGNLNESTARFYTDHILLTAHPEMLHELQNVFQFLGKKKKPEPKDHYNYKHLLVAQFNLQDTFLGLIDREIGHHKKGFDSEITIKLNNLEEKVLINKLYEAAAAGVKINLIIRGICCLVAGVEGLSKTITVHRIVDRYLEHGRVFVFKNNGNEEVYLGSADWMSRNIYRRIEVCFPIYNEAIKKEIKHMIAIQLQDHYSPLPINGEPVTNGQEEIGVRSQQRIYEFLLSKANDL